MVSVHDAILVIVHHETIGELEQNPVGRWLLQLHDGQVWLFVCVKLAGTALVCSILVHLYRFRPQAALLIAVALCFVQSILLIYLHSA